MPEHDDDPDEEEDDDPQPWFSDYGAIDMDHIQERINELLKNMGTYPNFDIKEFDKLMRENMGRLGPVLFGFSAIPGSDGKIRFRPFGNIQSDKQGKPTLKKQREPLVDVIDEKDCITIIAELPGINRNDIKLTATSTKVKIEVDTAERNYYKLVDVPREIITNSAKARFKNGVLEVKFKTTNEKIEGFEIPVE
jgi:HSP20 family protein